MQKAPYTNTHEQNFTWILSSFYPLNQISQGPSFSNLDVK
jgi:hypothetical protein